MNTTIIPTKSQVNWYLSGRFTFCLAARNQRREIVSKAGRIVEPSLREDHLMTNQRSLRVSGYPPALPAPLFFRAAP